MAEQILGLTDHHCRRSSNTTIAFIDGKVKSRKNKTLNWLDSKECEDQERIVAFAINKARKMRETRRQREVKIAEIQDQRLKIKQQKYDRSARSKVEKKLKSVWEGSTLLGDEFLDLSETKIETV